ncbi:MAG: hypothetical protein DWQ02_09645 [Bacteroidetes bacterium]|nr:MAG: hypothetical protein DWQ02_09645 [Bacteroidota bacterium]
MTNSYATSVEIMTSVPNVFEAICINLSNWWGKQDHKIDKEGIIFKVSWGEPWYQFKVIKFVKDEEVIWECIDANQKIKGLTGVEKEWVGTKIHWKLINLGNQKTLLEFKHEGLIPEFLCFDFCSSTWEHFLKESLVNYLTAES